MPRLRVRSLYHHEPIRKLRRLQRSGRAVVARWATILLLSHAGRGVHASRIAAGMGRHVQTVRERIRAFNRAERHTRWDLLRPPRRPGRTPTHGPAVQAGLVDLLKPGPSAFRIDRAVWRLADRVVIVDAGETLQSGPPAQVFASPRNARVAELVGIQNHFRGRFRKQEAGWAELAWGEGGAVGLRVVDKNRIPDGATVTWVIAGEGVDLLADASGPNALRCQIVEQLALGETSLCSLRPQGLPGEQVTLNLSTAQLRALGAQVGGWLWLRIAPEAIHIMPQKLRRDDRPQAM